MDAISAIEMFMQRKPDHATRCMYMNPAVPPLNNAKNEVPSATGPCQYRYGYADLGHLPSHVHMRIMENPKIVTKRKFRFICWDLPMRNMSLWSSAVPFFSCGKLLFSKSGISTSVEVAVALPSLTAVSFSIVAGMFMTACSLSRYCADEDMENQV